MAGSSRIGPSGQIARLFQASRLTPLLALIATLLGVAAVMITPKEEEPQIDVTMADVFVSLPGASAQEIENLIATPGEQVMSEIKGVEHVYSVSRQGQAVITVQFEVGLPRQEALVRLYNKVYSNQDWLPADLGASQPLVKPKGIDDVPVMTLSLFDHDGQYGAQTLTRLAHTLEVELKRVSGTRDVYTVGGVPERVEAKFDPARLAGYGLDLEDVRQALAAANQNSQEVRIVRDGVSVPVQAGTLVSDVETLRGLVIGMQDEAAVFLKDVARISRGNTVPEQRVMLGFGPAGDGRPGVLYPAVTLAVAKKSGENAVALTDAIVQHLERLRGHILPEDIEVLVTRDYGKTAFTKAQTLITDLLSATASVMLLVLAAMGWRQALVVGVSVIVTLLLTLVFSWAWGFTLNRVSLFALIFSIGILVDDAIVIVENINRRIRNSQDEPTRLIPAAVDEVGTPTIMASLTVMAALLPMAFVTGLMGPYMSPIPINASAGMVISQLVAFAIAPWLALRLLRRKRGVDVQADDSSASGANSALLRLFHAMLHPLLGNRTWRRRGLGMGLTILTLGAAALPATFTVILKMLPFDDKSELQVVVDMPEDTPMEETLRVLTELGRHLENVSEISDWQAYAGTASPINFNGLIRQYYLRSGPYQGDIQVNLADKETRARSSHEIAQALRDPLQAIGQRHDAVVKIVEVPPGPPVLSPVVAEVYGPDARTRVDLARRLEREMHQINGLVDIDTSLPAPVTQWRIDVDRDRAARLGLSQQDVVKALGMAIGESNVSYLHDPQAKYAIPIRVILPEASKAQSSALLSLPIRNREGRLIPLANVAEIREEAWQGPINHKDLLPVTYVTADMAGEIDSPLYGMFDLAKTLDEGSNTPAQYYISQPDWPMQGALKWEGEWQVTYETFRDMGIAYAVGVFLIYLLLVAQFRSYLVPLIIMVPIPLTLIGIMPGHALLGKEFTATSMIGMIALAGIIVRNSILLVSVIQQLLAEGETLEDAVVKAGAIRAKPIVLTAVSAMIGAYFILDDPIFNGLAVSLLFGLVASTLLTLLVVPLLYYALVGRHRKYVSDR